MCKSCNQKIKSPRDKKIAGLVKKRYELRGIDEYTSQVRTATDYHHPRHDLLIAVESLWRIERDRLNKELEKYGQTKV